MSNRTVAKLYTSLTIRSHKNNWKNVIQRITFWKVSYGSSMNDVTHSGKGFILQRQFIRIVNTNKWLMYWKEVWRKLRDVNYARPLKILWHWQWFSTHLCVVTFFLMCHQILLNLELLVITCNLAFVYIFWIL